MISIAVLGYGTVGSGVVEVIEKNKDVIDKRAGEEIQVKYILDLRDFPGDPYEDRVVHDVKSSYRIRRFRSSAKRWAETNRPSPFPCRH